MDAIDYTGLMRGGGGKRPLTIIASVAMVAALVAVAYYVYQSWSKSKKSSSGGGKANPRLMSEASRASGTSGAYGANGGATGGFSTTTGNCGSSGCVVDPQTGFQTFAKGSMGPTPKSCYEGSQDADYTHLGSYVKPRYMVQGCISESCGNSLSSASRCNKQSKPQFAEANGLSSGDLMFPGPDEACGKYCNMDYSRYDPCSVGMVACDPCKTEQNCVPFADTVIDEPRDLAYLEGLRGDATFLTTNFLQTRDPRGDIPVGIPQCALQGDGSGGGGDDACCAAPTGGSMTTHGAFLSTKPVRQFVF